MTYTKTLLAVACAAVLVAGPASAKDWIEKVDLRPDGIDVVPIEVRAGGSGYSSIRTQQHRFALALHARATSGERIVGAKLGSFSGVRYFESDGGHWSKAYNWRATGSGTRRTWDKSDSVVIPVSKLRFHGKDPVAACNALMNEKRSHGMSRSAVHAQSWQTTAMVYFEFEAVAARKGKAKKNKAGIGNTDTERASSYYPVRVECMARPARAMN